MKPLRILVFFYSVLGLLLLLVLVFPSEGIALNKDLRLRFASSGDLFSRDTMVSGYTDSLIRSIELSDDPEFGQVDTLLLVKDTIEDLNLDSLIRIRIDSIRKRVYPLEIDGNALNELASFFQLAEDSRKRGELVRILHYGDSQIENDRMTALIRYRFQKVFGGSGCGMVPAVPLYFGNPTFREEIEGNWIRYTGFGKRDSTLEHSCYGSMICFTSVPEPAGGKLPAIEFNFLPGRHASKFSQVRFFLHSYVDRGFIAVQLNDTISDTIRNIGDGYRELRYKPGIPVSSARFEFSLREGGRVYGIAFDPLSGVQVDNIAMRGSSGIEFSSSDPTTLDTMLADLNPGLILMQFGGNVVPYITNFGYYKRTFKKELTYLRRRCPGIPVVVIGPSDMSTRENGRFITFSTVEPVRDALREAALETGCAFWDMYEAMGGENSMQDFVLAEPPLATSDYIHFTPKGANLLAGMFFEALMLEYNKYKTIRE